MRLARALLGTAGALALTAGGAAAYADEPTQIRLAEVYEMTPGEMCIRDRSCRGRRRALIHRKSLLFGLTQHHISG